MSRKVAFLAQARQLVLSVNHMFNIDMYPDPVCGKSACLAQLVKVCPAKYGSSISLLPDSDRVSTLHTCFFSLCNDADMKHMCKNQLCAQMMCTCFLRLRACDLQ